MFVDVITVLIL